MTSAVTIREYGVADEPRVLDLLNRALGAGRTFERSTRFFRWKHLENPFGPSLLLVADGQEILGLRAFLRWQFRAGGRTMHAVRAVDTATHPGYQRMGIFSRLTAACLERAHAAGMDLVFNTPNRFSLPGYLKLGWAHVGRTTVMVRPLRPLRIGQTFLTPRGAQADGGSDGSMTGVSVARPVDELLRLENPLAELIVRDDTSLASGIRTARSVAFLRWRYAMAPSLRYGAHWVSDGGLKAAVICRLTRRRGLGELAITELFIGDPAAGRRALHELLRTVDADYAVAHCSWATPHRRVLLALGFVPIPRRGPHFTVRPLRPADVARDPCSPASWRLSLGDLEVF
ncbi:MAG: GNAT family N-acetyltransferase [bacterium]